MTDSYKKILKTDGASPSLISWFNDALLQLNSKQNELIDITLVEPVQLNDIPHKNTLSTNDYLKKGESHLNKCAVIKLNGGLGTTMGCDTAKSLLEIKPDMTFLECISQQIQYLNDKYSVSVPVLLMNSFYTDIDTKNAIKNTNIQTFLQDRIPKIDANNFKVVTNKDNDIQWCPPGHGNIFLSIYHSGILQKLLDTGIDTVFISNSDNVGAVLDPEILGYMKSNHYSFLMEVTPRTPLDIKGGTLIKSSKKFQLLERSQISINQIEQFENTSLFELFNTNNLWVHLPTLKHLLLENKLKLPLIVNKKKYGNQNIIQCETAMGSALSCFDKTQLLAVTRDRFLPVKQYADLFLLRSSLYQYDPSGTFIRATKSNLPKIELDYKSMTQFNHCVGIVPNIKHLNKLIVKGEFYWGENITLSGDVALINTSGVPVYLSNQTFNNTKKYYK